MISARLLFAAACLIGGLPQSVAACATGPYTFDFADPSASPRRDMRIHYFIGQVEDVRKLPDGRHHVTFAVLRDYAFHDKDKLGARVTVVTWLGTCTASLKTKQVGKFGLVIVEDRADLVETQLSF